MKTIALIGTFDTKGKEFLFVKELIESLGFNTYTIHTGVFEPTFTPDCSNRTVMEYAGEQLENVQQKNDRAFATEILANGMEKLLPQLFKEGKFDGVLSFGGSGGTSIATPGMRQLPIGVPKVMVSTVASGNTEPYVGTSDIMMLPSIVDVAGLNSISTKIFTNAVFAIAGMLQFENKVELEQKPLIATTMFGVTTPCVQFATSYLEERGYEVLIFHATGVGGRTMEQLIEDGYIEGVLDFTTTEWADELVGGVLNAGPNRLEAAGRKGIPQVVSLGALDMVNFGPVDQVPTKFEGRKFYRHNPTVTLMRTTVEENEQLGKIIAEKLNLATGPTTLMIPLQGVSALDAVGQDFHGPCEDRILFDAVKQGINSQQVTIYEENLHINEQAFAEKAAEQLIQIMKK